jgi:hypothetical protein
MQRNVPNQTNAVSRRDVSAFPNPPPALRLYDSRSGTNWYFLVFNQTLIQALNQAFKEF